jgi:N-acetylmuramoyl-L-alanine amidase
MALKFKKIRAKAVSFGSKRSLSSIKYIVIHYTGNSGDTARNNAVYFGASGSNKRSAGAHYFVDDGAYVYKSVPVNRVAWAVGGANQSSHHPFKGECTNANSLSIEMCSSASKVPSKTFLKTVELTKWLMKRYKVPASRVIRHYDVNGKDCPHPFVNEQNWKKFKKQL